MSIQYPVTFDVIIKWSKFDGEVLEFAHVMGLLGCKFSGTIFDKQLASYSVSMPRKPTFIIEFGFEH